MKFEMSAVSNKVLIVDDDPKMRVLMKAVLETKGFATLEAPDGAQAIKTFEDKRPAAVLLDLRMPNMGGIEALKELKKLDAAVPVIMVSAHADIGEAVQATKLGAYDFMVKPPDFDRLMIMLQRAIEKSELERGFNKIDAAVDNSLESFLGSSDSMKLVIEQIKQVAATDFSIIIEGETGTGKTTVARIIHNMSKRSRSPFVTVDVGTMPESLVESELFGYEKGSFTGADRKKKGFFEIAAGGTILIDDLQNVPLYIQNKLLRAVEDKKIFLIGSLLATAVDVRIIVATNIDSQKAVQEGKFRQDLFFRLSEFMINIPPLRERVEDIPRLARNFMNDASMELNKPMREISDDAIALLKKYPWPGNVRELKNVIRRTVLLSESDTITEGHIEFIIGGGYGTKMYSSLLKGELPTLNLRNLELIAIRKSLELTSGNKTEAATLLQIDYSTLLRKIKQFNLSQS